MFGGVTPNSEYEFLSGNSMFFLPTGSIVFQQYLDEQPYSLVSYLKGIDYNCIGMHPYYSNGWERQKVYPLLGFDECYFLDDYPREDLIRRFVSDREAFEVMTQRYEDHKRESDQNTFMFLVTMQNHGGYTYEGEDFEQTIRLEGYSEDFPDAEQYLSLIHETDDAVSWLVDYLSNLDRKCVLVFFGDHMPALSDSFYIEMHGGEYTYLDEEELKRSVPFFV